MAITSLDEMRSKVMQEVEIVGFEDGETITLMLKRLSVLGLMTSGEIPNALMGVAMEMFDLDASRKKGGKKQEPNMKEISDMLEVICKNVVVSPGYEDIKTFLTDDQKMEIFHWAQGGVKQLEHFRKES